MSSPSVDRVVQILDYLTTHPGSGFTLSELSRRLELSKTTLHRALASLTDRALVVRHPVSNEYRLGLALVPMGAAAERSWPALTHAKAEIERLATEYDGEALIVAPAYDDLMIIARAGLPERAGTLSVEGQREPLGPPNGISIIAWSDDETVTSQLEAMRSQISDEDLAGFRADIETYRRQGCAIAAWADDVDRYRDIYTSGTPHTPKGRREVRDALASMTRSFRSIPPDGEVPEGARMISITAPAFDPGGSLMFVIALVVRHHEGAPPLPELVRTVVRAAGRATRAVDGRPPGA